MKAYYLHNGKERLGPFSISDLQRKEITKDTLVWHKGMDDWMKAGELEELRYIVMATPPRLQADALPPPANKQKIKIPGTENNKLNRILMWVFAGLMVLSVALLTWSLNEGRDNRSDTLKNQMVSRPSELGDTAVQKEIRAKARKETRDHIRELVTVKSNAYKAGAMGGVSDLRLTLANNTDYLIDSARVVIHYIRSNGRLWETQYVVFNQVTPKSTMVLKAPDSNRGMKVECTVESIASRDLGL